MCEFVCARMCVCVCVYNMSMYSVTGCRSSTHNIALLREDHVGDTLNGHPPQRQFDGSSILSEVILLIHVFTEAKVGHLDHIVGINPSEGVKISLIISHN